VNENEVEEGKEEEAKKEAEDAVNAVNSATKNEQEVINGNAESMENATWVQSWDPRLYRLDEFLFNSDNEEVKKLGTRIPFASNTIATAFGNQVYKLEKVAALKMLESATTNMESYDLGALVCKDSLTSKDTVVSTDDETGEETTTTHVTANGGEGAAEINALDDTDKIFVSNTTKFRYNPVNYGVQSIMNPFSLTKLMYGISGITESGAFNYMYDIRDRRRYYDTAVDQTSGNDTHTVSNPTVSNIIKWANNDRWGRTPYSYQDFVFNKFFGIIPNNRLVTFRRYPMPCIDNLCFDGMFGDMETPTKDKDGHNTKDSTVNEMVPEGKGQFAPMATVVSYFGGDTGNKLSTFMNFTTGINWQDFKSEMHSVSGDDGTNPQMTIDQMFEGQGFRSAEFKPFDKMLGSLSTASSKIMSFGKFALATNGTVGQSERVMNMTYDAQEDPYGSGGPYAHRILGPVNRIDSIKARKEGIIFSQSFALKVSYKTKAIGGINPKAALLDCLGNAL